MLEAIADRVLALPQTLEVGSSNQAGPSGSVEVAVAFASKGLEVRVGVPLPRNSLVGLRLPTARDMVRYLPKGYVLIFTDIHIAMASGYHFIRGCR